MDVLFGPSSDPQRAEVQRLGNEMYEHQVRPLVEQAHRGKVVAIDVEKGWFAVGWDLIEALDGILCGRKEVKAHLIKIGGEEAYAERQAEREAVYAAREQKRDRRYSPAEAGRMAREWYETKIRALVEPKHRGRWIAIEVETGAFVLADCGSEAVKFLVACKADAQVASFKVGRGSLRPQESISEVAK